MSRFLSAGQDTHSGPRDFKIAILRHKASIPTLLHLESKQGTIPRSEECRGALENPKSAKRRVLIFAYQSKPYWFFKHLAEFDLTVDGAPIPQGVAQRVILDTIIRITRSWKSWFSYDFIISVGFLRGSLVSIALKIHAKFGFRTPEHVVISIGGALWPRQFQSIVGRLMRDSVFVCFTSAERNILMRQFGLERVSFVPYGVDVNYWAPSACHREYVFSGGMSSRDYSTFFTAVRSIHFRFIVAAGKDPLTGRMGFKREEIPPNAEVYYDVSTSKFRELLSNCLFVVLPLRETEHSSGHTVLVQASACGKAVISSRVVGTIDYLEEGKTGFFVKPGDHRELSETIRYLLNHRETCAVVGTNARILASEKFSEIALANSFSTIIRQIESHKDCEGRFPRRRRQVRGKAQ